MTVETPVDLVRLSGEIIQAGSKSFAAAAKLFDPETRASAHLLYAWCRHCDDMIDGQALGFQPVGAAPHDPVAALERLRRMTADALDGKPMADPVFAAFQRVVQKHAIPRRHPLELLEGFAMDVAGRRYDTIADTLNYCYHVAGVVGIMMAIIMEVRDKDTLDRASDLGLAFQLTNIVRDVVDDAAVGRVYLPQEWLGEAGIAAEDISQDRSRPALHDVTARLLALAEGYYESSAAGIARLPARSGWAIATARVVYRDIGREVLRRGARAWDRRVSTSKAQKIMAVVRGAGTVVAAKTFGVTASPRDGLWTRPQ
jgi:15-cis-phytoene synthase